MANTIERQARSARRSLLFVSGARPDQFDKAAASEADIVCLDLEDSVAPAGKDDARTSALAWIAAQQTRMGREFALRSNGLKTLVGIKDLAAYAEAGIGGGLLVLPKVDTADELRWVDALLTEAGSDAMLIALIESVEGLGNVDAIAAATPRLALLLFGAADLSAELGVAMEHEPLLYARSRCVLAARRAGIGLLDVPTLDFRNQHKVFTEAQAAKRLGFTGKAVVHPDNVTPVNACFTPADHEVDEAEEIIALFEASSTGLVIHKGKLIEAPVIRAMQAIVDVARLTGSAEAS